MLLGTSFACQHSLIIHFYLGNVHNQTRRIVPLDMFCPFRVFHGRRFCHVDIKCRNVAKFSFCRAQHDF